jgi:hypothetical protein
MSLNKVLNRPIFRKEALKKGALKPIRANVGIMVGSPYTPPGTPAVVPGQGVFSPVNTQRFGPPKPTRMQNFMRNPAVRLTGRMLSLPALAGGTATGVLADAMGMQDSPYKTGLQLAGAYGATRVPALAALSGIGMGPQIGLAALGGAGYYAYQKAQEQKARIAAMSPKEREEFFAQQRGEALAGEAALPTDEELFGKFIPKGPDEFKPRTKPNVGSGRVGFDKNKLKQQGDELLEEKYASVEGDADLNKIQLDSLGMPPGPPGSTDDVLVATEGKPFPKAKIEDQLTDEEKEKLNKDKQTPPSGPGLVKQGDGSMIDDVVISRARQLYDKLNKGQASQANLVLLANLASGLLTGTTRKAGIGGALEVMGQALGPAVNNYAIAKMKENEVERNSMETYLGYALEELKLFNEAAKGEPFEGEKGIIQFVDQNGVTRNVKGRETKAGTMEYATGELDNDGNMIYKPVGSEGVKGYGTPVQFFDKKTVDANTVKVGETLSNRYKTYKIANDVLDILNTQPTAGGPKGTIDLYVNRFGGALSDVFGRSNPTKSDAEALYNNLKAKIETNDTYTDKEKKLLLDKLDFGSVYKEAEKRIRERTGKIDSDTLEKLAVAETTLVYALANSFKDQDRLTQRDVQAAEKLVNLFTLTRGSEATRSSIKAIAEELESDILRYENDYKRLGGLEITLNTMRTQNKFRPQEGTSISTNIMQKYDAMSSEDLMKDFNQ